MKSVLWWRTIQWI